MGICTRDSTEEGFFAISHNSIGSSYHLNRILIIYRQCKPWENYLVPKRFTYIYKSDFLPSLWLK